MINISHAFVPSVLPCRRSVTLRRSSAISQDGRRRPAVMHLSSDFTSFRQALLIAQSSSAKPKISTNNSTSAAIVTTVPDHENNVQGRSVANLIASSSRLMFSNMVVRPTRSALALCARISSRMARLRSKHRAAYALSRMSLSIGLACIAFVVTRTSLTPPPLATVPVVASTSTASAANSSIFSSMRLPFNLKLPAKMSTIFRPFSESFGVVFLSEFGDKSMFATALMAMKHSPFLVCIGALAALTLMTFIACFLGQLMHLLPPKVTHYSSIALFVFFGLQMILQSRKLPDKPGGAGSERAGAEDMVAGVDSPSARTNPLSVLFKVASLIFVAEWCDRSMLATMALAASNNTVAVIGGATFANVLCTGMAVFAATLVASRISERVVALVAGLLFEVFAVFTFLEGPES